MLTSAERDLLQAFVARSAPGTAYLRRGRLLLLADQGVAPETAAGQVGVSIAQARTLVRAFKRQRLGLFPPDAFYESAPFAPDAAIDEAARQIMADWLNQVRQQESAVRDQADVTAVHEMRKAIRALTTAIKLFEPYFTAGRLAARRRPLRQIMRRLGRSRDMAVFLDNLNRFRAETDLPSDTQSALAALHAYWQPQKATADQEVKQYLSQPEQRDFWETFGHFLHSDREGLATSAEPGTPLKVGHLAPLLIYRQVAALRAFDDALDDAPLDEMHRMRLKAKALRYTLQFFEPVLGPTAWATIATVKQLQEHLGALNDARIALALLAETESDELLATAVVCYRAAQEQEVARLVAGFAPLWQAFEQPAWRQQLAVAVAAL